MSTLQDCNEWPGGEMPPHLRRRVIEDRIEALISELDDLDGDPDVEPDGDELDTSFVEYRSGSAAGFPDEDAEEDDPQEEDDPREHTALERHGMGFICSGPDDAEDSHDAELVNEDGGDVQDEPHDAEDEDTGIADGGALAAEDFSRFHLGATPKDKQIANTFAMRALKLAERHRPYLDLAAVPIRYSMRAVGNCMEPVIKSGALVVFDRAGPVTQPGDIVAVWFKPWAVPPEFPRIIVKRFVSWDDDHVTVESLNPPAQYLLDPRAVWSIHRMCWVQ
ncbi:S24 family peptidase [Xanthobacter sediminis]